MAKTQVAELVAKFTGDTTDLDKSIIAATTAVAKYTTAVGIAAVGALTALTAKQMGVIDANAKLADSIGVNIEKFEDIKLVADEAGISAERLGQSMGFLQRNIVNAASGSGAAADALGALGLSAKDLIDLTPDEQFEKIATALAGVENPAVRTTLAMDLFGKSGRDITNMLGDYVEKVAEAKEFNDRFNLSLTRVDAAKIEEANDAMGRVGKVAEGLGNTIAVAVSPLITEMATAFVNAGIDGEDFGEAVKSGMAVAGAAIDVIRHAVLGFRLTFNGVIQGMLEGVARAREALGLDGGAARALANESAQQVRDILEEMKNFESTAEKIEKIQAAATARGEKVAAGKAGKGGAGGIDWDALTKGSEESNKSLDKTDDILDDIRKKMIDLNNSTGDTVGGLVSSLLRGENAWEKFRNKALDVIEDVINNMFRLSFGGQADGGFGGSVASAIFSGLGLLGGGGSSISNPNIPGTSYMFADGGVVSGANMFPIGGNTGVMGEAGPEAIMPLTRGPGGKLSVQAIGSSSPKIEQHINISTGVQQTVRAELTRMLPQIAAASVGAIQNAQNRNILKES